jgi:hypothetical protein
MMGNSQLLDLLGSQTLDASISRMCGKGQGILLEPLAQRFGVNTKQTSTIS